MLSQAEDHQQHLESLYNRIDVLLMDKERLQELLDGSKNHVSKLVSQVEGLNKQIDEISVSQTLEALKEYVGTVNSI